MFNMSMSASIGFAGFVGAKMYCIASKMKVKPCVAPKMSKNIMMANLCYRNSYQRDTIFNNAIQMEEYSRNIYNFYFKQCIHIIKNN